jgi:formate hydrogenlyase subunit 6/NADH:ubiquinone oxidoreductase subunit I
VTEVPFLPREALPRLIDALRREHPRVIGPQVRDGAIVFDTLDSAAQLPVGVIEDAAPGRYRLVPLTADRAMRCFAWANGPQALKPLTFAPREPLWRAERDGDGSLRFEATPPQVTRTAVIGVRGCDLAALALQDQHFCYGTYADGAYNRRRRSLFLVAVDCAFPSATCFCASTGDGPAANVLFDVALTELDEGFLLRAKSARGHELLAALPTTAATDEQVARARHEADEAATRQSRALPGSDLKEPLFARLDHPRWNDVAARCLACSNCTSVCPTCFCHSEGDHPLGDGSRVDHLRQWDSCFNPGHSYIHGWVIRDTTRLRYRQWLTHKLGSWHDQYGRSGCVGCGRCIAWCPAGIDITAEARALLADDHAQ